MKSSHFHENFSSLECLALILLLFMNEKSTINCRRYYLCFVCRIYYLCVCERVIYNLVSLQTVRALAASVGPFAPFVTPNGVETLYWSSFHCEDGVFPLRQLLFSVQLVTDAASNMYFNQKWNPALVQDSFAMSQNCKWQQKLMYFYGLDGVNFYCNIGSFSFF